MRDKFNPGFTMLELLVVIVLISVLAALGAVQYGDVVERGRASEAKQVCARIKDAEEIYIAEKDEFTNVISKLGIGNIPDGACADSHFFSYDITGDINVFTITATRCDSGLGKPPSAAASYVMDLTVNRNTGGAIWGGRFSR